MNAQYKDVPILLIDVANFSTREGGVPAKRALIKCLQEVLTEAARFFMPYGNPWDKWRRHGTGDGYYFIFDTLGTQVALRYALNIESQFAEFNRRHEGDMEIRLRMALAFGDVELVEDQLLSEEFIVAERFISYEPFKKQAAAAQSPALLAMSSLYHLNLQRDISKQALFEELKDLRWSAIKVVDKHGRQYDGYVLGPKWTEEEPPGPSAPIPVQPFRVLILVAYSPDHPLPEAIEMAKRAAIELKQSELNVEVRINSASITNLRLEAREGCDLLIFYGHGSENGNLIFNEGPKEFADLSARINLEQFWRELGGCFVFACYGERFAQQLPCPWLAFRRPVLREAPKGFMHDFVQSLKRLTLSLAIQQALDSCADSMAGSFARDAGQSTQPFPERTIPAGQPVILRQSPGISGRHDVDFGSIEWEVRMYPEHDPFVGRVEDLKRLSNLPSLSGDQSLRQCFWAHGGPGLGKSALLRQHAAMVRDLCFYPESTPVWLLHAYCYRFVIASDLVKHLSRKAKNLYGLAAVPEDLPALFKALEGVAGIHVWILDDVTYLEKVPGQKDEVYHLARLLAEGARHAALPLQLVLSARFDGPKEMEWQSIPVAQLSAPEAADLARQIKRLAGAREFAPSDWVGSARLFQRCGGSTAHYKRGLQLSVDRGIQFEQYLEELESRGSLDNREETEFSLGMIKHEIEQLRGLESRHGFAYSEFLKIYHPMILRAGYFTLEELLRWFDGKLMATAHNIPQDTAYKNGLTYLARLGFVSLRKRRGEDVFYMPPNQRLLMRECHDPTAVLPHEIEYRAPKERLSESLEHAQQGSLAAIGELLQLEQEYKDHLHDVNAAEAVAVGMGVRAELLGSLPFGADASIRIYDDIVRCFAECPEAVLAEKVAGALFSKGATLDQMSRSEEAIVAYDEVARRYGERPEAALAEQVAKALCNKGVTLARMNHSEAAMSVFDNVVHHYSERPEAALAEKVASALINKGVTLDQMNRSEEALAVFEEAAQRYDERPEATLAEQVASALVNKGVTLGQMNRSEEEIAVFDEVARRYGERLEAALAEQVAKALLNKGVTLSRMNLSEEEMAVYDEVARRYGERPEAALAEQVARALVNKGATLGGMNRSEKAMAVNEEVVRRYGDRSEAPLAKQVAKALFNKGVALVRMNREEEAMAAFDEVARRYGERPELALAEQVAKAMFSKGVTLGGMNRSEEEMAVYDEVARRYSERPEAALAEQVARALFSKSAILRGMNRREEEIAAYDEMVRRYGERPEMALAEQVAKALFNKSVTLDQMKRKEEAKAVLVEVNRRYKERKEPFFIELMKRLTSEPEHDASPDQN